MDISDKPLMQKHLTEEPITPFQPHHQSVKLRGAGYRTKGFFFVCLFVFFFNALHNLLQASLVAQVVKNLPTMWEAQVRSLGWEDPLEY